MTKEIISTQNAPAAIGAYSQAVKAGDSIYISGQIPLPAAGGELVSDQFGEQAEQVFANLSAVAQAAGSALSDAVKLNVYLTNLDDFAELNTVMEKHISPPFPARAAVQVAALPRGAKIEIDAVLYTG